MNILCVSICQLSLFGAIRVYNANLRYPRANRDKCDLFSIWRPCRRIIFSFASRQLTHVAAMAGVVRSYDMHFQSTVATGNKHNLPTVRGPKRLVVDHISERLNPLQGKVITGPKDWRSAKQKECHCTLHNGTHISINKIEIQDALVFRPIGLRL